MVWWVGRWVGGGADEDMAGYGRLEQCEHNNVGVAERRSSTEDITSGRTPTIHQS